MRLISPYIALSVYLVPLSLALQEKIWSSVVYTFYGEHSPHALPYPITLTPLGAQQLVEVGSTFRGRYLDNVETRIGGLSLHMLVPGEITVLARTEPAAVASAEAFMQGFYPPVPNSSGNTTSRDLADMVNGTAVDFPLNGYQYPQILTLGFRDPSSVYIAGQVNCVAYGAVLLEWLTSDEARSMDAQSSAFYSDVYSRALQGVFAREDVSFLTAFPIYEYLNYQHIHNSTAQSVISLDDVNNARYLADKWVSVANGNTEAGGSDGTEDHKILSVAGQTLARFVVSAFETNYRTGGTEGKLSLLFGSFEPMVAFAFLSKLASDRQRNFYGLPNPGASIVFELFSMESNSSADEYPLSTDLMVRFFLRNGTDASDASTPLVSYPLFGRGPEQPGMPYQEFKDEMVNIMMSVSEWCLTCGGDTSVFCPAYAPDSRNNGRAGPRSLRPAVAGVIGAVVGLIVAGLIVAFSCWAFGLRIRRTATRRRFDLGGFKGGNKLASDLDLVGGNVKKTGHPTAGIIVPQGGGDWTNLGPAGSRGDERVGSWEMWSKMTATTGSDIDSSNSDANPNIEDSRSRRSWEDDDPAVTAIAEPVKVHEHV
ncbi:hypothetical protein RJZ56_004967 [Blastomyces dermatitidis]|uniref:Histidine acid phosphatase n=2 Tax=Ajellomyces dermatitidis TaxID=5039 RepID=F2TEN5_AJEDA|nr:uncharacterized protein BDCG_04037 [Blastomyces dermatitidis ER-3]EEQ88917.1 hypothetical protein BDCG_04037 [Blastomyces dermatitidis ER-3]EGE81670.1 hypothetical protein BDDG_04613 [Blastomyces dermatitidis ATCC 18188]